MLGGPQVRFWQEPGSPAPVSPPYTVAVKATTPVAWWKLDTAKGAAVILTAMGHGFTATPQGQTPSKNFNLSLGATAPAPPPGLPRSCFYQPTYRTEELTRAAFTASGALLAAFQNHDFSVAAWTWFNPSYAARAYLVLTIKQPNPTYTGAGFAAYSQTNKWRPIVFHFNGFVTGPDTWPTLQAWTFVVMTYTAATKALVTYTNGVRRGTVLLTTPINIPATTTAWSLAGTTTKVATTYPSARVWEGGLASVAVWDTVLSAAQITLLYTQGLA